MGYVAALVGNPNCGKTSLFNALTGSHQYVGNWPGVTVERREARFTVNDLDVTLIDLPGAYSLTPYSVEERVTRDFLQKGEADVIINVVDGMNLERGLFLTLSLLARGLRVIVAVNMMDELRREGGSFDRERLSQALSCPVIPLSAKERTGFDELFSQIDISARDRSLKNAFSEDDVPSEDAAYARAAEILRVCQYRKRRAGKSDRTDRLDRALIGKYTAFPILLCVMLTVFFFSFGAPGKALTRLVERLFRALAVSAAPLLAPLPGWAQSLMLDGVLSGAGSVVGFLPQVLILYFFMAVIEDTGYMARAAFVTDRLLRSLGLTGRSVIPLIMGLGCTATAATAARGVENDRDRKMTAMLLPCMSCGAKLPVYSLIAGAFFPGREPMVLLSLYVVGIVFLALEGHFLNRFVFRADDAPFLMELPEYRLPLPSSVARRLAERARSFLKKAGSIIVLMSAIFWFFRYFSPDLTRANDLQSSICARFGLAVCPFFARLGFGSWQAVCALVSGLVAKEGILSALRVIFLAPDTRTLNRLLPLAFHGAAGAYAYLLFILLTPPCVSAVSMISRELRSARLTLVMLALETASALAASFVAFQALQRIL